MSPLREVVGLGRGRWRPRSLVGGAQEVPVPKKRSASWRAPPPGAGGGGGVAVGWWVEKRCGRRLEVSFLTPGIPGHPSSPFFVFPVGAFCASFFFACSKKGLLSLSLTLQSPKKTSRSPFLTEAGAAQQQGKVSEVRLQEDEASRGQGCERARL